MSATTQNQRVPVPRDSEDDYWVKAHDLYGRNRP